MQRLADFILRQRAAVLAAIVALTLLLGYQAAKLRRDNDIFHFLPAGDPDVRFFMETGERFGSNFTNMVALETADLFTAENLKTLRELTAAIERVEGVTQSLSLTNVLDTRRNGDSVEIAQLIPPEALPTQPNELTLLRQAALHNPNLAGSLVSEDGRTALIAVSLAADADREAAARQVKAVARQTAPKAKLYFGGYAMVMDSMQEMINADMTRLIPITVAVVILVLFLGFGSARGVLLPLAVVALANGWTLGLMSLAGIPLTLLTSLAPVVIVATGASAGIYVLGRYYEGSVDATDQRAVVAAALGKVNGPILLSGLAAALGFLALLIAPMTLFKQFGVAAALGSLVSALLSVTFLPALLSYLPLRPARPFLRRRPFAAPENGLLGRLGRLASERSLAVLLVALALVLTAGALLARIPLYADLMTYFPPASETRVSEALLRDKFGGSQFFFVNFQAKDVRDPVVLDQMDRLMKRLRSVPGVNYPQSIVDVVALLNRLMHGEPGVPDSREKIDNLWFFLQGQKMIAPFIDKDTQNAVVQARLGASDPRVLASSLTTIQDLLDREFPREGFAVPWTGLTGEQRDALRQYQAKHLAEKIRLDLRPVLPDLPAELPAVERLLVEAMSTSTALESGLRQPFRKIAAHYLSGADCDIPLPENFDAEPLAEALSLAETFTAPGFAVVLQAKLPPAVLQEDPDSVSFAADALANLAAGAANEQRYQRVQSKLLGWLADDYRFKLDQPGRERLAADLRADLWGVNAQHVFADRENYRRILGREPADGEAVRWEIKLTGWPVVSGKFDARLLPVQLEMLALVLAVLWILLALYLRSPLGGLLAVSPAALTVLIHFGVMGALGFPLDNSAVMISGIALGISVGYAIVFTARLREEAAAGASPAGATVRALTTTGRAISMSALSVALGFLVLVFSEMTPQKRFGLLIALALVVAAAATFTVYPAALGRLRPRWLRDAARGSKS
ncbi:MAG: MMPL family transporter [Myxococcales bacterium]|nr:MMPL family transporter [Myxococcales bacterium]